MSVDLILQDVTIATMVNGRYGLIPDGSVLVDDGGIQWVGPAIAQPETRARKTIAGRGRLVTPGLIDCHTHIVYAGNRAHEFAQRLAGVSYEEIAQQGGGILATVRATRACSVEALAAAARPRIRVLMREGVTTLEIKTGYGLDLENEAKMIDAMDMLAADLPVEIAKTFLGAHALPPEFRGRKDDYVEHLCQTMIPALASRVEAVDAFCEGIGFTPAQTRRIFQVARQHRLGLKIHAEQLSNLGGTTLAANMGALSADHLEYIDREDAAALAVGGTVAVLLPCAAYYLREPRRPRVDLLRRFAVPIAVASDANPGTAPGFSLLLAMNMACVLFGLTPEEALAGVTVRAARALGRQDRIGTVEAGKQADLVLWNAKSPDELVSTIGYNPGATVIKWGQVRD
ncbi:MAG: imidazolonepropionase [Anaerolineae bacterium]|nr:imidazolonepropionase [Anaerolineae bacterium]